MIKNRQITVIIPAFNEEQAIGKVISAIPGWVDEVIVVNNGSTDGTAGAARSGGARVVFEPRLGYGSACLKGIDSMENTDIVVFLDGDYSDYPDEMGLVVEPIVDLEADLVIGSRVLGKREKGALTPQARFGNWLSCILIRKLWGIRYTDLGPFRAIDYASLQSLGMRDRNYGWTVEMQIKAAQKGLTIVERPVKYRNRIGKSKVSGTLKGVILAGVKILYTIFKYAIAGRKSSFDHGSKSKGLTNS
jgi:glycosyltransferase involved in cell wall biosynthesis